MKKLKWQNFCFTYYLKMCLNTLCLFLFACQPAHKNLPHQTATIPIISDPIPSTQNSFEPETQIENTVSYGDKNPSIQATPLPNGTQLPTNKPSAQSSACCNNISPSGAGNSSTNITVTPTPTPNPLFYIKDVLFLENGQSIQGSTAQAAIKTKYNEENNIKISIKGNFKTLVPFSESSMRYTFEQGLLHQSFHGQAPSVRALLNNSLLLESIKIEENELQFQFNAQFLPDLQLPGLHRLQLIAGSQQIETFIRFEPDFQQDLSPIIEKVETIEQNGEAKYLKLLGRHFFLNGGWTRLFIDGQPINPGVTSILISGKSEILLDLSQIDNFNPQSSHQLRYQSPLGNIIYSF